jgi:hypothetical protein
VPIFFNIPCTTDSITLNLILYRKEKPRNGREFLSEQQQQQEEIGEEEEILHI